MDGSGARAGLLGKQVTVPLGIVLERRRLDHPWKDHSWMPVDVIPGAPAREPRGEWLLLKEGEGWARYHSGTLPLNLFRKETEAYKITLAQVPPRLFVILRTDDSAGSAHEVVPFAVTASASDVQEYLDSSEDIVEPVPMPAAVVALIRDFIDQHHEDVPFIKRKRKRFDPKAPRSGPKVSGGGSRE
ncbi:MAG TPA: DUF3305 domain-containing protein [Kiloniellales bacterium]|jgi:hypothetical protein